MRPASQRGEGTIVEERSLLLELRVAVGPIPDNYTGQRPKSYVVLKPSVRDGKDRSVILRLLNELVDYNRNNKVRHK